ncbi:MAG TPA: hypothetical protein VEA35_06815 [Ramlibacter sp.]|nr:hypothetical protein [Candidatus Limnocylindrales bacterium]HYF42147.1 hypothetical protein [Ramlibacter sp.]
MPAMRQARRLKAHASALAAFFAQAVRDYFAPARWLWSFEPVRIVVRVGLIALASLFACVGIEAVLDGKYRAALVALAIGQVPCLLGYLLRDRSHCGGIGREEC